MHEEVRTAGERHYETSSNVYSSGGLVRSDQPLQEPYHYKDIVMLGTLLGDISGAAYEFDPVKTKDIPILEEPGARFRSPYRFTDDSVCTVAIAEALLHGKPYDESLVTWVSKNLHDGIGYGPHFLKWALNPNRKPYGSWGNGSAMRVAPVAWLAGSMGDVIEQATASSKVTHDHDEGIRGAQATAVAVRMALEGFTKKDIRDVMVDRFKYLEVDTSLAAWRPYYGFEVSCQKSVPQAIRCFLESASTMDAILNAISLGGDADTMGAIAGAINRRL